MYSSAVFLCVIDKGSYSQILCLLFFSEVKRTFVLLYSSNSFNIYSMQLTNKFFLFSCFYLKIAHDDHFILQRKKAPTMTSTKTQNGKSAPSDAERGANRTLYVVFLSLVIDLLGFTLILPLLPSILDYYGTKQVRHSSTNYLSDK